MTDKSNPLDDTKPYGAAPYRPVRFDSAEETLHAESANPAASIRCDGILKYMLSSNMVPYPIQSNGEVVPRRNWQANGNENVFRSMLYYAEEVTHFDLRGPVPMAPGESWDFAGPRVMSTLLHGSIVAGGQDASGPTMAYAEYRVVSSNTFVFGRDDDPVRHFLFFFCPGDLLEPAKWPTAKRAGIKAVMSFVRASDNLVLYEFALAPELNNSQMIQVIPIQDALRQWVNKSLVGETIRADYTMTSSGSSVGQAESQSVLVGARWGLALLPMRRV